VSQKIKMAGNSLSINTIDEARSSTLAALTVAEAAHLMRVDPRTLRAAAKAGDIPSVKVGSRVLIPREKFLALVEAAPVESVS
jgi:excisionase family DNA binding protein